MDIFSMRRKLRRKRWGPLYVSYADKVMGYDPIAYWPLNEASGTVAHCLVNPAQNGTYSSDVSGWPVGTGIGDGNTAPYFDGTNDHVAFNTATFRAAWNGQEGTAFQWIKVNNAGIWTDSTRRDLLCVHVDGTNYVIMGRNVLNSTMSAFFVAGGTSKGGGYGGLGTPTTWIPFVQTWSRATDQFKVYWSGMQLGATANLLGLWAGQPANDYIGNSIAGLRWWGWLGHVQIYNRALTLGEIAALSVI